MTLLLFRCFCGSATFYTRLHRNNRTPDTSVKGIDRMQSYHSGIQMRLRLRHPSDFGFLGVRKKKGLPFAFSLLTSQDAQRNDSDAS